MDPKRIGDGAPFLPPEPEAPKKAAGPPHFETAHPPISASAKVKLTLADGTKKNYILTVHFPSSVKTEDARKKIINKFTENYVKEMGSKAVSLGLGETFKSMKVGYEQDGKQWVEGMSKLTGRTTAIDDNYFGDKIAKCKEEIEKNKAEIKKYKENNDPDKGEIDPQFDENIKGLEKEITKHESSIKTLKSMGAAREILIPAREAEGGAAELEEEEDDAVKKAPPEVEKGDDAAKKPKLKKKKADPDVVVKNPLFDDKIDDKDKAEDKAKVDKPKDAPPAKEPEKAEDKAKVDKPEGAPPAKRPKKAVKKPKDNFLPKGPLKADQSLPPKVPKDAPPVYKKKAPDYQDLATEDE